MPYEKIIALVPNGEHFDASVINEGVWLSAGHINRIEESLNSNVELLQKTIDASNLTVNEMQEKFNLLQTQAEADKKVIDGHVNTINDLQTKVSELEKTDGPINIPAPIPADPTHVSKGWPRTSVDEEMDKITAAKNAVI